VVEAKSATLPAEIEMSDQLKSKLKNLPPSSGVYQFRSVDGTIIYIGKAKNLRNRVRSYFQSRTGLDQKRDILVSKISDLDIVVTDSEVEALLLENNLIKEYNPRYNIRLKDDKTYPYIVVTNEPYPRVFPTRIVRHDGSHYYGPYSDVRAMHLMLRTLRGIFPLRSCEYFMDNETVAKHKIKICLDFHIHKCLGPCEGHITQEEYSTIIAQVEYLLKGKTKLLQGMLEQKMHHHAQAMEFEQAAEIRNRLQALQKYQSKQKVATPDFADRDIIALATRETDAVGIVFRVREGKIIGKQHMTLAGADLETENQILERLAYRYYTKTMDIPPEILLPNSLESTEAFEEWLTEKSSERVQLHVPKIGDKLKLVKMCQANAMFLLNELRLQKMKTSDFVPRSVLALKRDLHLTEEPRRIECFDISHFQGSETVASMVCFQDGKPRKSEYRKFKIESVQGVDDFASIREVVRRRYSRVLEDNTPPPDLIVIDGGKGQLSSAVDIMTSLQLHHVPIIGLAKRLEEVFLPGESLPMNIPKTSSGLKLLQRIRDEAHRFAITFHRGRRNKATLQTELEAIDGVGTKRAQLLLETLGSVRAIRSADIEAIAKLIGWSAARNVNEYFLDTTERSTALGKNTT